MEAQRDIPIDYLLEMAPNQEDGLNRANAAEGWYKMGVALKLFPDNVMSWDLRKVQEFIARTPPHKRCPCVHGVKLEKWEDHYYRCDVKHGLKKLEAEQAKFKRQIEQVESDKLASEEAWRQEAARVKVLEGQWVDSQVAHMTTAFLQKITRVARAELARRCEVSSMFFEKLYLFLTIIIALNQLSKSYTHELIRHEPLEAKRARLDDDDNDGDDDN